MKSAKLTPRETGHVRYPGVRVLIILGLLALDCVATDVWYSDVEARSPSGRYVATARSPENRKKEPRPFAGDFTFSLRDTKTRRVLWRYNGGPNSEPAGALYVSDSGAVISVGSYDALTLFKLSGERIQLPGIFELLPRREVKRYADESSIGTLWSQFSWKGFLNVRAKEFFYIRTYWRRTIVIDTELGRIAKEWSVKRAVEAHILAEAKKTLALPEKDYWERCEACGGKHINDAIKRSVFVLARHKVKGREKLLRLVNSGRDGHVFDTREYFDRLNYR